MESMYDVIHDHDELVHRASLKIWQTELVFQVDTAKRKGFKTFNHAYFSIEIVFFFTKLLPWHG